MDEARKAEHAVLKALARRPENHGFHELSIEGHTRDQIKLTVKLLYRTGLVYAHFIHGGLGPARKNSVYPSTLTAKGRAYLKSLELDEAAAAAGDGQERRDVHGEP